ncbi:MAG: aminopeptidase P family protein [Chloroflexi bacterium]|nr:aminopeptidase P family protein [Chloroflexota bacterium]
MDYQRRLNRAQENMVTKNIGLMYLTYGPNLWYLAGMPRADIEFVEFGRHADHIWGAYIGIDGQVVLVAGGVRGSVFKRQSSKMPWVKMVRSIDDSENPDDVLAEIIGLFDPKDKGIVVDDRARAETVVALKRVLPHNLITTASDITAPLRVIKDQDEIATMTEAGRIADEVCAEALKFLEVGITEFDLAHHIYYQLGKRKVAYPAFSTAVIFSSPDRRRTQGNKVSTNDVKLQVGDSVSFDFGACFNGYCSNLGRTAFIGNPPPRYREAYDFMMHTHSANLAGLATGRVTAVQSESKAGRTAEGVIRDDDYVLSCFVHGIGVDHHELPFPDRDVESLLMPGMLLAVETSITDRAGYVCQLSDVVLVKEKGIEPLTNFHKNLSIID